jgi:hypothetical protein
VLHKETDIKWRLEGYVKEGKSQRMGAQIENTENWGAKGEEKEITKKTKRNKIYYYYYYYYY